MKKRLLERGLSLLLAFVMVLALAPVFTIEAEAADIVTAANLASKIANTSSGVIVLTENATLPSGEYTIKSGVTLLLPYSVKSKDYEIGKVSGYDYANTSKYAYREERIALPGDDQNGGITLTLSDGAVLNVASGGKLVIGGQYSGGTVYTGQTLGSFSRIKLNKGATVNVSGILSCFGYIDGLGKINVFADGIVYEPFVITNYAGGDYSSRVCGEISPFTSYALVNIQSELTFNKGSWLKVYVTVTASNMSFGKTTNLLGSYGALFIMIGSSADYMVLKYRNQTPIGNRNVGRTTIEVYGDVSFGALTVSVGWWLLSININSANFDCPLSYNFTVVQNRGQLNVGNRFKLMPGSEVIICEGATMNVSSSLAIMEGVVSDGTNAVTTGNIITANAKNAETDEDLCERGRLIIDGTLNVTGKIGGKIETNGQGVVNFNGTNSVTVVEGDNKNTYNLKAKLMLHDTKYTQEASWTEVGNGTYYGVSNEEWTAGTDAEKYFYYNNGSKSQYSDTSATGTWSKFDKVYDNGSEVTTTMPDASSDSVIYYADETFTETIETAPTAGVVYYKVCEHEWGEDACNKCGALRYSVKGETVNYYYGDMTAAKIAVAAAYNGDKMVVCDVNEDGSAAFALPGLKADMTVKVFLLDANHAPIAGYVPEAKPVD